MEKVKINPNSNVQQSPQGNLKETNICRKKIVKNPLKTHSAKEHQTKPKDRIVTEKKNIEASIEKKKPSLQGKSKTDLDLKLRLNQNLFSKKKNIVDSARSTTTVMSSIFTGGFPKYFARTYTQGKFDELRNRLTNIQTEFVEAFTSLKRIRDKGNNDKTKIEIPAEVKLVTIKQDCCEKLIIKNPEQLLKIYLPPEINLTEIKNKILSFIESGFRLCQELSNDMRTITVNIENNEGKANTQKLMEIYEIIDLRIDNELNEKQSQFCLIFENIQREVSNNFNVDCTSILNYEKDELNTKLEEANCRIRQLLQSLDSSQAEILQLKQEITENNNIRKDCEKQRCELSTKIKVALKEIDAKSEELDKIKNDLEAQREKTREDGIMTDEEFKMQKNNLLNIIQQRQEAVRQLEYEHSARIQLEANLSEKENYIKKLCNELEGRKTYENLVGEKDNDMRVTRDQNNEFKQQAGRSNEEIIRLQETNEFLRESIIKLEENLTEKSKLINELEENASNKQLSSELCEDFQSELNILKESEEEKHQEINTLKNEITKAQIELQQLQNIIFMDKKLLQTRTQLINYLQDREITNQKRIDEFCSQTHRKTLLLEQMNYELSAKGEELQNLFSTLGTKQIEIIRQENIIKKLEENGDKHIKMRKRQEEKISKLENEISQLKSIIESLIIEEANFEEKELIVTQEISTREIFNKERRKKRQIEIAVKKIKR